ncbi:TPA: ABC transporter ATP-binding protein [Streptococcus equi subsp. zooepidemicus]|nr:ABC transporter ATP-binding protein [Streptococcus equi subsp. zooepidemicus]HEK9999924.1 ABC transporter ATP-binding protein [Streptococcus equi subsp. zooepidemicus]HEL0594372.1 ABC transporter ATP-binding protein [Streptococcus equi subsp. zooepidemicus]HEL0614908.1 ABC transporter ATP-binding protein [Streptococcus equi subsp. zooepidemicus]HEL0702446.1 ABC transporter ATP-binding protein [Streptococcus equi subsp. zooepidemicus]
MEGLGGTDLDICDDSLHGSPVIKAKQLQFSYTNRRQTACELRDCLVEAGQFIVLCGQSGSGKSTFLKLLNGLIPDYFSGQLQGSLKVLSHQAGQASVEVLSRQVSSVFQNPASQFFYREVKHELVFPCENQGLEPALILERLETLAADFDIKDLLEADMLKLSGGQKQRVAIAAAIMQGTAIMVFDEPTANLDHAGVAAVKAYLKQLKAAGKTIIVAEHRLHYLLDLADHFYYFSAGRLEHVLSPKDLLALPDQNREALGLRRCDLAAVTKALRAKTVFEHYDPKHALQIKKLEVRAGSRVLYHLNQLSFGAGQITGITGANGLGKSQLALYLAGIFEAKEAKISYLGVPLSAKERLSITSLVLQDVGLQLFAETVARELNLGHHRHQATDDLVNRLGLSQLLDKHPASLSGGEQQRVMIAASLLSDKEIFILDEPSSGLDLLQMQALVSLLKELKQQKKVVIVISHDEELLDQACDSIYQLSR